MTILLSERRKYVKYDPIFFKRKENSLKLFELLNKVTQLWSYAIRCLSFWKKSRFLEEQWVGKLQANKSKILKAFLLVLPYINHPFLLSSYP